eukprot:360496-Chlamydomonas_euryale.AAC.1
MEFARPRAVLLRSPAPAAATASGAACVAAAVAAAAAGPAQVVRAAATKAAAAAAAACVSAANAPAACGCGDRIAAAAATECRFDPVGNSNPGDKTAQLIRCKAARRHAASGIAAAAAAAGVADVAAAGSIDDVAAAAAASAAAAPVDSCARMPLLVKVSRLLGGRCWPHHTVAPHKRAARLLARPPPVRALTLPTRLPRQRRGHCCSDRPRCLCCGPLLRRLLQPCIVRAGRRCLRGRAPPPSLPRLATAAVVVFGAEAEAVMVWMVMVWMVMVWMVMVWMVMVWMGGAGAAWRQAMGRQGKVGGRGRRSVAAGDGTTGQGRWEGQAQRGGRRWGDRARWVGGAGAAWRQAMGRQGK